MDSADAAPRATGTPGHVRQKRRPGASGGSGGRRKHRHAHGSSTGTKFIYCNRAPREAVEFQPYDLVACGEKEVDPLEYFTISAKGVVRVCAGEPSEHLSLSDWMHQSLMFSMLSSMAFFRLYVHRKILSNWNENRLAGSLSQR